MAKTNEAVLDAADITTTIEAPLTLMQGLAARAPEPPKEGDIVEGPVIALDRAKLYIDLPPFGTGVIFGREYLNAREVIKRTNVGDRIAAKVISVDSKEGYIELSLKEARQAIIWAEAEEAVREKRQVEILVKEANKGGLILEWQGIAGFLPPRNSRPSIIRALSMATRTRSSMSCASSSARA